MSALRSALPYGGEAHARFLRALRRQDPIVIARFVPIIRTFAPMVAGVEQMCYARFVFYNVFGGVSWVASMTWAGYLLGSVIPNISRYLHLVVRIVIVLSMIPIAVEVLRARCSGAASGVSGP